MVAEGNWQNNIGLRGSDEETDGVVHDIEAEVSYLKMWDMLLSPHGFLIGDNMDCNNDVFFLVALETLDGL